MPSIRHKRVSVLVISCALIITAGLSACSKTQSTDKLLADARQYQQKGDNKAAIIQLKNALQKDPENKDARYMLGVIYTETGDALSAEKELRKAISLGLPAATALPNLAKALLQQGQFQKVLDETSKDLRAKTDADLSSIRANAFLGLGKKVEAKEAFEQALKANPDFADALIGMAKLSIAERDMLAANNYVDLAVRKNPSNIASLMFKGDLLRTQRKLDEALVVYGQTIKIQPDNAMAFLVRANLEIGMKKYAEAQQDIDAVKKLSANPVLAFYTQGLLDFSQNKHAAAWDSLMQVQHLAPGYMPGVLLSGAVQYALGSFKQAEQFLKKYVQSDPGNLYAQKLLIGSQLKDGDAAAAVATLEPLLKPENKDIELYALAGESYMQLKNFTKATEYFEKASTLDPKSAEYHTALGMSKLGEGENGRAISELEKAADLNTKSPKAGILLVMTHLRMKEFDKALSVAKTIEKEQPDNPLIQNLKGGIYLSKKDMPSARSSFEKAVFLQPAYFPAVVNLARLDLQDKKPDVAKKRFEAVLEKDKKNLQAMLALASLAVSQRNNDEAKMWLERANTDNPDSLAVVQLLAVHYVRMGDKQKTLALVKKAQASHPTLPEFMELLAQTQISMGDKTAALDSYGKLAAMLPESPSAQFKVAATYMAMENDTAALESVKKTLRLDAKYLDAQLGLAALLAKKGNFDEALLTSRQIQQQNAKSPIGFIQEGDILLVQKKYGVASQSYEKAFKLLQDGQLMSKIHNSLVLDGRVKEADSRMALWLKDHSDDNKTRLYFAMYNLTAQKNKQLGIEQLQIVVKNEPQNLMALNNLAWAYGEEKDPRALDTAEKAYKLAAENPAIMDTLGWILVEQGNTARGLPLIQKASALMPDSSDVHYHLALASLKSGDKIKARKELEQIIANGKVYSKIEEVKVLLKRM